MDSTPSTRAHSCPLQSNENAVHSPNIYIHAIGLFALFIASAVIIIDLFYCIHLAMVTYIRVSLVGSIGLD